jgi:exopolysaccharide biosynthesis protein
MCGIDRFSVRMGDGPIATTAAIGGVAPIIIDGLPYGETNVYSPGVPAGAPVRGEVEARYKNYLTQKSNAMYAAILARGGDVGKTALGYSSYSRTLYVLGQADGQAGLDANGIRANFIAKKIDNAVFLDCSDSATLYFDGKFLIKPGDNKNEFLTVAVDFR